MQNIEIKTALEDRPFVEDTLEMNGATREWERLQIDTFFDVPEGWLKLREAEEEAAELISYRRPTDDAGPRASDYDVVQVEDTSAWKRLLGRVLPGRGVVEKRRTLWLFRHTRVHLDRVSKLGDFLELETVVLGISLQEAREEADDMIQMLALEPSKFLSVPYLELIRQNET